MTDEVPSEKRSRERLTFLGECLGLLRGRRILPKTLRSEETLEPLRLTYEVVYESTDFAGVERLMNEAINPQLYCLS